MKNGKADSIFYECEQSLKRLKIDVIDLYQIHWPDVSTPVEETVGALEKLRQQGKVRAIGVSNYDAEWLERGSKVATIANPSALGRCQPLRRPVLEQIGAVTWRVQ